MTNPATQHPTSLTGDFLGLPFPPTIADFLSNGSDFLTRAFHAAGTLEPSNRVIAITHHVEFIGGGMGRKLLLSVDYERPAAGLHPELFVKFQLDFDNPLRELFGPLMQAEIRFALLSRRDDFPITVPKCYFADFNAATTSGILITERIAYGEGGIEPRYEKCLDYQIANPLDHYRALTLSMARLAAFHKSGKFGPAVTQEFPFDPAKIDAGTRIPYTLQQLQEKLEKLRAFCAAYPQLIPAKLREPRFLDEFCRDIPLVLEFETQIRAYLNANVDYVALCHWNMNLDNAWFWTDGSRELKAGLLDWGSVGQMSVAQAFYGMTCSAETALLADHKLDLLKLFVEQYRDGGGPSLDIDELLRMYKLSVPLLGIAWMLDAPSLIEGQIPDLTVIKDRFDPALAGNFLGRVELQILTVFLNEWLDGDIGAVVRRFVSDRVCP